MGRVLLQDLFIGRRMVLKWTLKTYRETVDWVHLAQDRVQWLALVTTIVNLQSR
jgi:hypothetical protein